MIVRNKFKIMTPYTVRHIRWCRTIRSIFAKYHPIALKYRFNADDSAHETLLDDMRTWMDYNLAGKAEVVDSWYRDHVTGMVRFSKDVDMMNFMLSTTHEFEQCGELQTFLWYSDRFIATKDMEKKALIEMWTMRSK